MDLARYIGDTTILFTNGSLYDVEDLGNKSIAIHDNHAQREVWGMGDFYRKFRPVMRDKDSAIIKEKVDAVKRTFDTGATRDTDEGKLDFEGFLSPTVLKAFAEYMNKNRKMADGSVRDSDNWQKGIPKDAYMKSMWRHFFDVWQNHRGISTHDDDITNLTALMFNVMGMLHEKLKEDGD